MSEIQFKIWDPEDNHMGLPDTMEDIANGNIYEKYYKHSSDFHTYTTRAGLREGLIFLRYTGFKARNDQEIYDGDILLDHVYPEIYEHYIVFWDKDRGMWMLKSKVEDTNPRYFTDGKGEIVMYRFFFGSEDNSCSDLEVVGNIHTEKSDEQI